MADATSEYAAANGWREIDLTGELWRTYHYDKEVIWTVSSPGRLFVRADDRGETHRLVTEKGLCFRPNRGWIGISWEMRDSHAFIA